MQGLKHSLDLVIRILETLYEYNKNGEAPTGIELTKKLGLTYTTFLRYVNVLREYGLIATKRVVNRNQYTLTLKGWKLTECLLELHE